MICYETKFLYKYQSTYTVATLQPQHIIKRFCSSNITYLQLVPYDLNFDKTIWVLNFIIKNKLYKPSCLFPLNKFSRRTL